MPEKKKSQQKIKSLSGGGDPNDPNRNNRNQNKKDKKQEDEKKRKKNEMSKSEFENNIGDRYEHVHSGIYKLKKGAKPIANAELLQWDFLHGEVEAYANDGKTHLGAIDPMTGEIYKQAEYGRVIKL